MPEPAITEFNACNFIEKLNYTIKRMDETHAMTREHRV